MTSEKHNLPDDILDQATQALRETPIPPGPPPEVLQRIFETPSRDIEIAKPIPILEKLQLLKPLAKIAAVLVIAAGVIGLFSLLFPDGGNGGSGSAFAEVAQQFLNIQTGKYKLTVTLPGQPPQTCAGYFKEPGYMRHEMIMGPVQLVQLFDMQKAQMLQLMPRQNLAIQIEMKNLPEEKRNLQNMNMFHECRKRIEDAKENPEVIVEELGKQMLDDHPVIVYRVKAEKGMYYMTVWADPDTKLPLQIQISLGQMFGGTEPMEILVHDFEFNVPLDESLFSMEIPPGYQVVPLEMEMTEPQEEDLIKLLQLCAEKTEGQFPDSLNIKGLQKVFLNLMKPEQDLQPGETLNQKRMQILLDFGMEIGRGIAFVHMLPEECDRHYAGQGVTTTASDTPIFWYRPIGSENYRIIYGDLKIEECLPDDVPKIAEVEEEKKGILNLILD